MPVVDIMERTGDYPEEDIALSPPPEEVGQLGLPMGHASDNSSSLHSRWGALLINSHGARYFFVRNLAEGSQGIAQLCVDVRGQLVVRKRAIDNISAGYALRRDRECKMAEEIANRLTTFQAGPESGHRFSSLLDDDTLPASDEKGMFFRESWWQFCDGGGSLGDFVQFLTKQKHHDGSPLLEPHALILNITHDVLQALRWLNGQGIHHRDCHIHNIFLKWRGTSLVPVVGDFGDSRITRDPVYNESSTALTEFQMADLSRLPDDSSLRSPNDCLPSDYVYFLETLYGRLKDTYRPDRPDSKHAAMLDVIMALIVVGDQERERNRLLKDQRPFRADISTHIASFKAVEQDYLRLGGAVDNDKALAAWRLATSAASLLPLVWATRTGARDALRTPLAGRGPYAIVDFDDETSIQAGVTGLRALRRDQHDRDKNDKSSSGPGEESLGDDVSRDGSSLFEEANVFQDTPEDDSLFGRSSSPADKSSPRAS